MNLLKGRPFPEGRLFFCAHVQATGCSQFLDFFDPRIWLDCAIRAVVPGGMGTPMSDDNHVRIELAPAATDEVRLLVRELEAVLAAEYPPEQRHGFSIDALFQPHVRFFLARRQGAAVGCGGVALFPEYAEVKRMYVRGTARGQGIADALLARIEDEVRGARLSMLRLETGTRQIAAMRLYIRTGFRECPAFGAYALKPPDAIASSVFFEKRVGA